MEVKQAVEKKQEADPQENYYSHSHAWLAIDFWNQVGSGYVNGHAGSQRQPVANGVLSHDHRQYSRQRC